MIIIIIILLAINPIQSHDIPMTYPWHTSRSSFIYWAPGGARFVMGVSHAIGMVGGQGFSLFWATWVWRNQVGMCPFPYYDDSVYRFDKFVVFEILYKLNYLIHEKIVDESDWIGVLIEIDFLGNFWGCSRVFFYLPVMENLEPSQQGGFPSKRLVHPDFRYDCIILYTSWWL